MTQICPGFGVAPVPILLSVIFKPDGVVMVVPTAWAVAVLVAPVAKTPANAVTRASAASALAGGNRGVVRILLLRGIDESPCSTQYERAMHVAACCNCPHVDW